jgi:ribose transport system permease protein
MVTIETQHHAGSAAERRAQWWTPAIKARETGLIVIILTLFTVMSFISPYFLTVDNLRAMSMAFAVESIVVVGSVTALAMVVAGWLFLNGIDPWAAAAFAIAVTTCIGMFMGFLTTVVGLHHFIVSLGVMVIARGICLLATGGRPLGLFSLPPEFKFIGQGAVYGIPLVIIIFVVVVVSFDFLLRRTTAFRKVFYTGSNPKAAAYSGIRVGRVVFATTTLCSALCGVAGVIYMARFGSAQPSFGVGMELNVIAAAVIGGASLSGGAGTIFGAILGAVLLSVVSSSLSLLNVSVYWQDIIKGSILLTAVLFDHYLVKRRR